MAQAAINPEMRQQLLARLERARAHTDALFQLVRPAALYDRPIPERHRIIFYLGHLETFDWNLVGRGTLGLEPLRAEFDRLFAFGIDPTDGHLPDDKPSDWPSVAEIQTHNQRTRQALDAGLREANWSDPGRPFLADGTIVHVTIEHRLMHEETLAYMLHQMPPQKKIAPALPAAPPAAPVTLRQVEIPAGAATLGLPRTDKNRFGWDNEFEVHRVQVPRFAIGVYPVTNGQYLEFLRAGGYQDQRLWSAADWAWKEGQGITHPHSWTRRGPQWYHRTMFGQVALPLDWPVYISYAEASAYAAWAGKSLPTEAQWHRAAYGTPTGAERAYPWGDEPPEPRRGNFDFLRWEPVPVSAHPEGASAFGVADLVGNGWEWTSTPFAPFPGFKPFPFYPGYSANFFDGKHFVMKGGGARTAACMLRRSFRNWFQSHYPYIPTTFRCVEN